MDEKTAVAKFYECADRKDLQGCIEALKHISAGTLNTFDDDGYDMLISAVVSGNECAVAALMYDGNCDWTREEHLCGLTAKDFSLDYPEMSIIRQAFVDVEYPSFVCRDNKVIRRRELYDRIMADLFEADKACFNMLEYDFQRVSLLTNGKISKEDFENWLSPDGLDCTGQIFLLEYDEEYAEKFVNWDKLVNECSDNQLQSLQEKFPEMVAKYKDIQ